MSSVSTQKKCAGHIDCKQGGVINCVGCSKVFCMKHMNDHRRPFEDQMKSMINQCDNLKKILLRRVKNTDSTPLITEINKWEKESIEKIQQQARKLRQIIVEPTVHHTSDLSEKLRQLFEQLKEHRDTNNFIEADIEDWTQKLKILQDEITAPSTICINRHNNNSIVDNISISIYKMVHELFDQVSDTNVIIDENKQIAVHEDTSGCTEIRGERQYDSGCHEIRLCVEQITNSWTFLGINSKSVPVQKESQKAKSAYGWSSDNYIWSNGQSQLNDSDGPRIEIQDNDRISLLLDCDNHTIMMINRRTNTKLKMHVDVSNCPLPWQTHIILFAPHSRVCILSS